MADRGQHYWTWRYFRNREIARGQRWWLSQDPEVAAEELAGRVGGLERARRWAAQLLAHLDRLKGAA